MDSANHLSVYDDASRVLGNAGTVLVCVLRSVTSLQAPEVFQFGGMNLVQAHGHVDR
jgi:hypothetical protein